MIAALLSVPRGCSFAQLVFFLSEFLRFGTSYAVSFFGNLCVLLVIFMVENSDAHAQLIPFQYGS